MCVRRKNARARNTVMLHCADSTKYHVRMLYGLFRRHHSFSAVLTVPAQRVAGMYMYVVCNMRSFFARAHMCADRVDRARNDRTWGSNKRRHTYGLLVGRPRATDSVPPTCVLVCVSVCKRVR